YGKTISAPKPAAVAASAKPAASPKATEVKPDPKAPSTGTQGTWLKALFSGDGAGFGKKVGSRFRAARQWWNDLSPAKVRSLEAKLREAETGHETAARERDEKGTKLTGLEAQLQALEAKHEAATKDNEGKGKDIEGLRIKLQETETQRDTASQTVSEKA